MSSSLALRNVRKSYGAAEVIKGVDLTIERSSFVVFVGPSGCGKSTLLRMIAGLEPITSGDVEIDGKRVNDTDPSRRGIAMVFQTYALYPHMSVRENMGFALRFAKVPKDQIERQVNEAARILALEPLLDRRPGQLSGGQRQRVAIGRAIVREPKVFLFDEPLSNLDAELRVQMRVEIARLHKELGTTMIYVTHDQTEAMTLADKIVVLRSGIVEQVGRPLDLYDDPANQFVAGFIGSPRMNFLVARVIARTAGRIELELVNQGGARIALPAPSRGAEPGDTVTVGIRPEHFAPPTQGEPSFAIKVDVAEHLGATTYVYANTAGGEQIIAQRERALGDGDDQTITLAIPAAKAYLFDQNGTRLR